jgi:phage/plasmid-like protein (TIGR03299 family)
MSHCIENHDTIVLGSNKPAWHGLGTVFPGLLTPLRAFAEGVGAREILEVPAIVDGVALPGYKGLVAVSASGNRSPLSIVGDGYGVLQDSTFFEILEQVYGGRPVVETAGTLRSGKRIWALVQRPSFEIVPGDVVKTFDLWVNRHDATGCYELHRTNVRVVCQNTWNQAIGKGKDRVFGVRHTTNVVTAAKVAAKAVQIADESGVYAQAALRKLAAKRLTVDEVVPVYRNLLEVAPEVKTEGISVRVRNNLDELVTLFRRGTGNEGRTAWDAFNAVTEFVDHKRTVRSTDGRSKEEARFESALLGTGDALKASAYDQLLALSN